MSYDTVIIGAGLSGLAAGARLALVGRRVCVLEAHAVPGGLNSYYRRHGRNIDVGLHAFTNFSPRGTRHSALTRLLRQLRLRHEELALAEPAVGSRIVFPGRVLRFTNDPQVLRADVAANFPDDLAGFDRLWARLAEYDETSLEEKPFVSTRTELAKDLRTPLLREMLLAPTMYYGSSTEDDPDWEQFALVWQCLLAEGISRPAGGVRRILDLLSGRLKENGGELRLSARVERLIERDGKVVAARLASGEEVSGEVFLSCAGAPETAALCGQSVDYEASAGKVSVAEVVLHLDCNPRDLGVTDAIAFLCRDEQFRWREPEGLIDDRSAALCSPALYGEGPAGPDECCLRVTAQASYRRWHELLGHDDQRRADPERRAAYQRAKEETRDRLIELSLAAWPDYRRLGRLHPALDPPLHRPTEWRSLRIAA